MSWSNLITIGLAFAMALGALFKLPAPASWIVAAILAAIAAYAATAKGKAGKSKFIVRLKGFAWTREDFCRGWLITGDTGSGKTRSGINQHSFRFSKTIRIGAVFALMTKACIGKRSWRWPRNSNARTI